MGDTSGCPSGTRGKRPRTEAMRELHAAAIAWADALDASPSGRGMDEADARLFAAAEAYRNAYRPRRVNRRG